MKHADDFGRYLALGVTVVMVVQGLINMSVVLGMMPTKGIPLPMISYGGSSLLSTLALLGMLMNVSEHAGVADGAGRFERHISLPHGRRRHGRPRHPGAGGGRELRSRGHRVSSSERSGAGVRLVPAEGFRIEADRTSAD